MMQLIRLAFASLLALSACRSPLAAPEESSEDTPTTEVGLGVHGWPIYERDVLNDGVRTDVLWPVSSIRTLGDGTVRRADILKPIGHWYRDQTKTQFAIRPLIDVETEETDKGKVSDWDILWPLVGWKTAPDESRSHVFPLWWQGRGEDWSSQVGFPLYWRGSDEDERWAHLWPLYGEWGDDNETTRYALWPFFWHETDIADARSEWTALWPIFQYGTWKDGGSSRAFPLWWHERDEHGAWSVLFPLWFKSTTPATETQFFGPFYGRHQSAAIDLQFFGGPLCITATKAKSQEHSLDLLWPFFHHATRPDGQTTRLFPLVWSETGEDRGYFHAWPFFGRAWNPKSTETSTVWPFFRFKRFDNGHYDVNAPWPLFRRKTRDDGQTTALFPLLFTQTKGETGYCYAWPFYGRRWNEASTETSSVWPLVRYERWKDGSFELHAPWPLFKMERDTLSSATRLFPLFSTSSESDGTYSTNIGILFNQSVSIGGDREMSLFPFFSAEGAQDGSY
ncbi:MAG TPA: hypothetical protein VM509_02980, partial [Planctomycetota bacterium]|nr:hypothetical protein [Planctomycetota bacterium]